MSTPWRVAVTLLVVVFILSAVAGIAFTLRDFDRAVDMEEKRCVGLCRAVSDEIDAGAEVMDGDYGRTHVSSEMKRLYSTASVLSDADGVLMRYYYRPGAFDEYVLGEEIDPGIIDLDGSGEVVTIAVSEGKRHVLAGKKTVVNDAEFYVMAARDITDVFERRENGFFAAAVAASVIAIISAAAGGFVSALSMRRITDLCRAFDRVGNGYLNVRVPEKGAAEMQDAARRFNLAADTAEKSFKKTEAIAEGRKEFVDRLAHEMKTPLTSILCVADLLRIRRTVPDDERVEQANIIVGEANRLKKMSSKLLELATAGGAELEMRPASVLGLLGDSAESMRPALTAKGIALEIREGSEDGIILCDRELFKSLIYNIVDNAAKASESGQTVTLTSRINGENAVISVTDRGIGMTKEVLKKITEPFFMADKERSRREGGAGIGLSLCVEIAQRHGANLFARSKPGKGTTVSISVPLYKEEAE